jgi:hypothetical protein
VQVQVQVQVQVVQVHNLLQLLDVRERLPELLLEILQTGIIR